jgi:hypothetical protein
MSWLSNDQYAELEKSSTYSHTWLGLNPQIGRLLSRIVVPLVYFLVFTGSSEIWYSFVPCSILDFLLDFHMFAVDLSFTSVVIMRYIRFKPVRTGRLNMSLAGLCRVVEFGTFMYCINRWFYFKLKLLGSFCIHRSPFLIICTKRSACPLVAGW